MECRHVQFHLSAYIDGDLSTDSARRMDRHFVGCRNCRRVRDEAQEFDAEILSAMAFPGQPYAYATLAARLPDVTPLDEVAAFLPTLRVSGRSPRLAVAVVMVLLVAVGQVSLRQGKNTLANMKDVASDHDQRIKTAFMEYLDTDLRKSGSRNSGLSS